MRSRQWPKLTWKYCKLITWLDAIRKLSQCHTDSAGHESASLIFADSPHILRIHSEQMIKNVVCTAYWRKKHQFEASNNWWHEFVVKSHTPRHIDFSSSECSAAPTSRTLNVDLTAVNSIAVIQRRQILVKNLRYAQKQCIKFCNSVHIMWYFYLGRRETLSVNSHNSHFL